MRKFGVWLVVLTCITFTSFKPVTMKPKENKMVIEIWSDVVCPFCYIGKRRFEEALNASGLKNDIRIVWKSFQLNPNQVTDTTVSVTEDLARQKGWSLDYTKQMSSHVTTMASGVGLHYDFDKAVVANSLRAHRVLKYAESLNKGSEMKEQLLSAYFTKGLNIDDANTLADLAAGIGLDNAEVLALANDNNAFMNEVNADINEARQLGIQGVPFFVYDRKYAISGAQETDVFINTLKKAVEEWRSNQPAELQVTEGAVCKPNEDCD